MKPLDCEFESEALAAVLQSRWPDRVDAPLRAHVPACAICSDVIAVAGAIDAAREESRALAAVPDSGRVWWIAQLRARREAADAAGRPITAAHVIALACAAGLLKWIASSIGSFDVKALVPSATALLAEHGALAVGTAAVLFLVPAVVYLAIGRD